ncbi:MAG: diaminopimelate decarboxylase [Gemmatimonadales bacterium]
MVRSAERRRGGVGQSVLTGGVPGLFADAGLTREAGVLRLGDVSLSDIAAAAGTPVYVYNAGAIRERYRELDRALARILHRICYAVKANSTLAILRILRDLGAGADIVSGGELARVLAAGFDPSRIVFSGVGKSPGELRVAIRAGLGHLNVESREELDRIAVIADEERRPVSLGIRVNPDVTTETHPYISTGKSGIKFGVPIDQVAEAAAFIAAHPRLELTTLAMHLGSQLVDTAPFQQGISRLLELARSLRAAGITSLEVLDIGGGLGIRYGDEPSMDPRRFADAVVPMIAPTGYTTYLEPGRYLVGSAGVLVTEVLYRKHSGGKEFIVVDAGMNDLVRPSHYQAYHEIVEVEEMGRAPIKVDVVGPVCETGDFLALDRSLPGVGPGERLAILGAGAYGFVMASNYNSRPRPAEVVVDGGSWWVARPRETVEELYAQERLSP